MAITHLNPEGVFPPYRNYSHAVEISGDSKLLIISGLNGYQPDGQTMPESFEEQGELIWKHIGTILRSAGMSYANIVSLRTYLRDPSFDEANVRLRMKYLGDNKPASTVVCCQLLETKWKLEIEVMAAKSVG
ncbi:Enamine deaminase RidA, house cleaning of reactive enamine intermediates, YjgF/YER057c/UK114 family [Chryseolinea serpens]|uniref:Enamine deaminase RidA, house cleaning of reactive enamine intermediates, YjgF/YER057c/UK114 family n=1 Tax=Chryseolinea serpens TaxID=947013 RepID=A0A1M5UTC9_9BACT|nr:RidA family protein [Chryseolinea serpens]SHH66186.1 Enamine deaminase RidA, house cleaning of reactive enamine intermediates, YjgF/YER057c/UK114 family [Chryseolinea serpens]